MANTLMDCVIHWRKKLDKHLDEDTILNVIRKLSKIPMNVEILRNTHIGNTIRKLSKRDDIVGEKASTLLRKWRDAFTSPEESVERNSKPKSASRKENINKSKSFFENEACNEQIMLKNESPNHESKLKHDTKSFSHSVSQKCSLTSTSGCGKRDNSAIIPSHKSSKYTYEKNETPARYSIDYDPHVDESEGYNPECPELFPGEKCRKAKKSDILEANELSQKRKIKTEEQTESSSKNSKKSKCENRENANSVHTGESKKTREKKVKHSSCDSKSGVKSESTGDKIKPKREQASEHNKLSSNAKKSKSKGNKNSSEKSDKSKSKLKLKLKSSEEFTSSEVRFEDCLGFNDIVTVKKKKSSKPRLPNKKSSSTIIGSSETKSTVTNSPAQETKKVCNDSSHSSKEKFQINVPKPSVELNMVDIVSETQSNYQLSPEMNLDFYYPKKKEVLTDEDAIKFTSSRREKTAVYSGKKHFLTEVPSLFECCTRVLIENIDAIEYLGEIPYYMLKPVLERGTPVQLFDIERYNPDLLDFTTELWEIHCKRDYKLLSPQENETWRDLYLRAHEERERKLKSVTANICASMSKSKPVRQVKLAYVDSVVKPPREFARRQAKSATTRPVKTAVKTSETASKTLVPTTASASKSVSKSAAASASSVSLASKKPKVAPLMAKTLKDMKQCFRR